MCTNCFTRNGTRELDFIVVWLDAAVGDSALKLVQKKVQLIMKHFKNMDTEEDCEEYIRSAQLGQTIVVVTTEDSAKIIVPAIHHRCQVGAVFVYNGTSTTCDQWKSIYTKV
ncbi:unnamed protein product [Adineta ricciae]|uniref:Uncharacterized protein n=1 Tax=Adineta ricciae TaxID=249248 RepID=A0A816C1H5_ADIRI|nr:unnamed protein product [Adineta ricciae]